MWTFVSLTKKGSKNVALTSFTMKTVGPVVPIFSQTKNLTKRGMGNDCCP